MLVHDKVDIFGRVGVANLLAGNKPPHAVLRSVRPSVRRGYMLCSTEFMWYYHCAGGRLSSGFTSSIKNIDSCISHRAPRASTKLALLHRAEVAERRCMAHTNR